MPGGLRSQLRGIRPATPAALLSTGSACAPSPPCGASHVCKANRSPGAGRHPILMPRGHPGPSRNRQMKNWPDAVFIMISKMVPAARPGTVGSPARPSRATPAVHRSCHLADEGGPRPTAPPTRGTRACPRTPAPDGRAGRCQRCDRAHRSCTACSRAIASRSVRQPHEVRHIAVCGTVFAVVSRCRQRPTAVCRSEGFPSTRRTLQHSGST